MVNQAGISRHKKGISTMRTVSVLGIIGMFAALGMYAVRLAYLKQQAPVKPVSTNPAPDIERNSRKDSVSIQMQGAIADSDQTRCKRLSDYCMDSEDHILACDYGDMSVKVFSLDDKLLDEYILAFRPQVLGCLPDKKIVVAGKGKAAVINPENKNIFSADIPGTYSASVTACEGNIFITVRESTRFSIYKMNSRLQEQKRIVKDLRGCCGQFDIAAADGCIYAAANCRFKVVKYDLDGKELASFGEKGRGEKEKFNGCCEPKNLCFDPDGNLLVSESADCCVKRFSKDGKFLGMVGRVDGISGCVRVTLGITKDGSQIYMLDTERNVIRLVN